MKSLLFTAILLISAVGLSAGGGGEHDVNHIPWEAIRNQGINLGILLVAIIFMLRKSLPAVFQARQATFLEEAQKTEAALKLAEAELKDIKTRLAELEKTEATSVANAQKEAIVAGQKIISDTHAQGKKIIEDTALIINAEVLKAKSQIREKIISQSMAMTEQGLKASSTEITKKSEPGFLQDLGQVKA